MNRILVIALAGFYFLFALGTRVEVDACCQALSSVMGVEWNEGSCSAHAPEVPTCCAHSTSCDSEHEVPAEDPGHKDCDTFDIVLALEDEHRVPVEAAWKFIPMPVELETPILAKEALVFAENDEVFTSDIPPPDPLGKYIQFSSLITYG